MAKLSINLLPKEFTQEQVKRAKFYKVQLLGVAVILLMTFLASVTVALRILQSHHMGLLEAKLAEEEGRINNLKDRQASLLIIKNRLVTIDKYLGSNSNQADIYKLIDDLLPSQVSVTSLSVDRLGQVLLSAVVSDAQSVDDFISDLVDKEKNQQKVTQVSIDSLNRGRDGFYRLGIRIKPKS